MRENLKHCQSRASDSWKSRSQRKHEKFRHAVVSEGEPVPENTLGYKIPRDIVQLQKNYNLVGPLYKLVEERSLAGQTEVDGSKGVFCLRNEVLFRKRSPEPQLVVPKEGRELVLSLGHSVPWAGHLGKHKTTARIIRHFYWRGMRKAMYCKTCPQMPFGLHGAAATFHFPVEFQYIPGM